MIFVVKVLLLAEFLPQLQLFIYFDHISLICDLLVAPKLKEFNLHSLIYVDDWLIGRLIEWKTTGDCKRSTSCKFQFFTLFHFIQCYYCLRKRGSPCARRECLGEMEVQHLLFLTAALHASDWSNSSLGSLTSNNSSAVQLGYCYYGEWPIPAPPLYEISSASVTVL
jgi:hypothetical protein